MPTLTHEAMAGTRGQGHLVMLMLRKNGFFIEIPNVADLRR